MSYVHIVQLQRKSRTYTHNIRGLVDDSHSYLLFLMFLVLICVYLSTSSPLAPSEYSGDFAFLAAGVLGNVGRKKTSFAMSTFMVS